MASTIGLRINNEFVLPTVAPSEQNGTTLFYGKYDRWLDVNNLCKNDSKGTRDY